MKEKLNIIWSPSPYRRLEVFRRICPEGPQHSPNLFPNNILYELDLNEIFFREAMNNMGDRNGIVGRQVLFAPTENAINISRGLSTHINGHINYVPNRNLDSTMQESNDNGEMSEALMYLQLSEQNNTSRFKTLNEEIVWNQNHLMNMSYCNGILQNNTHVLLPENFVNEMNYFQEMPPINPEYNQVSLENGQTQYMAQQHTTTPLNVYAAEFVVPHSEPIYVDTMNSSQSDFQDDMNFLNDFFQQNDVSPTEPTLQDFPNEFYELTNNINPPQTILQNHINFPNELNNVINQPQFYEPYEFYRPGGAINQSQPIFLQDINFFDECPEPSFINNNYWQPAPLNQINCFNEYSDPNCIDTGISQPALLEYMNGSNGFSEPGTVNFTELRYPINLNGFLNPNFENPIHFSQPLVFDYMNNNKYLEQNMNFQLPNGFHYTDMCNEFSTPYISHPSESTLPACVNVIDEDLFYINTPRPILNRNNLIEYQVTDLMRNSTVPETNFTEDYTTEYSLTHAIARPTGKDISNDNFLPPHVLQRPEVDQLHHPLTDINTPINCVFTPNVPRPILNRSYLDELPKLYTSQAYTGDHENSPINNTYSCKESLYVLPGPRAILNRNGVNGFFMPCASHNFELDQTNPVPNCTNTQAELDSSDTPSNDNSVSHSTFQLSQKNYHAEFPPIQKTPRPKLNHVNGFRPCNIPEDHAMILRKFQTNAESTFMNLEASQVSEFPPNDE